jgi:hypothetical protein
MLALMNMIPCQTIEMRISVLVSEKKYVSEFHSGQASPGIQVELASTLNPPDLTILTCPINENAQPANKKILKATAFALLFSLRNLIPLFTKSHYTVSRKFLSGSLKININFVRTLGIPKYLSKYFSSIFTTRIHGTIGFPFDSYSSDPGRKPT